jgi:hypothetical protein
MQAACIHEVRIKAGLTCNSLADGSSSAFALYIERFAYYCGFYFAPFRPSNSDFGYLEEGESTAGYTFNPVIFCLPWHRN